MEEMTPTKKAALIIGSIATVLLLLVSLFGPTPHNKAKWAKERQEKISNENPTKNNKVEEYKPSTSYSTKSNMECEWCGKSFKEGGGYNTIMRQINSPANEYSSYCSKSCATSFLRSTR